MKNKDINVIVIGAGYVGLVTAACLAEIGTTVECIDVDAEKIRKLCAGKVPIFEPGLDQLIARNTAKNTLQFANEFNPESISNADIIFIAVGTPPSEISGQADLSYLFAAVRSFAPHLSAQTVIVDKSTVPVGTARCVNDMIMRLNPDAQVDVVSNPEFLREGRAIKDFMMPDRLVLGTKSPHARKILQQLYNTLIQQGVELMFTGAEEAELIKYASNAFLATKITFINELSQLCDSLAIDVLEIAKGMGLDDRIGQQFLRPGPGYGGSCFPKDTQALLRTAQSQGVALRIVEAVIHANDAQRGYMVEKISRAMAHQLYGKRIAILGVTFKADTDDVRESPAFNILPELLHRGAELKVHDPQGLDQIAHHFGDQLVYAESVMDAAKSADALVLITDWEEYKHIDAVELKRVMAGTLLIDLRNIFDKEQMQTIGFNYIGVGR